MRIYVVLEDSDLRNTRESRLDILHQSLLILQDSILNKELCLKVYIRTVDNELIDVNPAFSVPRTLELFEVLIQSLVTNRKVKSTNNNILLQLQQQKLREWKIYFR
uniref:Uncharacterized protein n=1 Tax=Theileria parva TaxID=5875 RepID=Q4N8B6_THEPA|eukprot:XP_766075.1 hypothetical protein [Theileria parva strain Muguga]